MHARARVLVVVVLVAGCSRVPASVDAPAEVAVSASPVLAPIELDPASHEDGPLPLFGALSFDASRSDSCSQSWANTHWQGRMSISAEADGHATLRLDWDHAESGGSWQGGHSYARRGHDGCTLDGRVRIESAQLLFEFEFEFPPTDTPADHWPPYECRPNLSYGEAVGSFEMRCAMTSIDLGSAPDSAPTQQLSVLGCELGDQLPWLLAELIDRETRTLELADERLHVRAVHDDLGDDTRDRWLAAD